MGKVFLGRPRQRRPAGGDQGAPPKRALQEEQALLRFRREMDLSRRVQHPNLARTLDVGSEEDIYFMVMEYIPGESLYETVKGQRGGPLRVPDTARFFLKVLDGLGGCARRRAGPSRHQAVEHHGHARGRRQDPRPRPGPRPGATKGEPLTRPNVVIGTLDYASPEQLGNAAAADRRSDLYSIGCTLYFTLAGRPAVRGGRRRQQDLQAADGRPRAAGAGGAGRPRRRSRRSSAS